MRDKSHSRLVSLTITCLTLLFLCSCSHLQPPHAAYVAGDRATFNVIDPVIRNLADGDPTNDPDLTGANSSGLLVMMDSWRLRLESAETAITNAKPPVVTR